MLLFRIEKEIWRQGFMKRLPALPFELLDHMK